MIIFLLHLPLMINAVMAINEALRIPITPADSNRETTVAYNQQPIPQFPAAAAAARSIPGGIDALLDLVYTGDRAGNRPVECKPILGGSPVRICSTGQKPHLKISSFEMSPHPMVPGYCNLTMVAKLTKAISQGSRLQLDAFNGTSPVFSGTLDLCEHISFAKFNCPVKPFDVFQRIEQTMFVPDDVPSGIYSFVASAYNKRGEEFVTIAASIDIQSIDSGDGTDSDTKDEL